MLPALCRLLATNTIADSPPVFLDVKVMGLTWGKFNDSALCMEGPDIIIGADCFYDNFDG